METMHMLKVQLESEILALDEDLRSLPVSRGVTQERIKLSQERKALVDKLHALPIDKRFKRF